MMEKKIMTTSSSIGIFILSAFLGMLTFFVSTVHTFQPKGSVLVANFAMTTTTTTAMRLGISNDDGDELKETNDDNSDRKRSNQFWDDLKGMFQNFDDVVDDFLWKKMGAGEQWYGKRKYNPSGRVDGDYNGMGKSDYSRIEIARVQMEEKERKKQLRLQLEEEKKRR